MLKSSELAQLRQLLESCSRDQRYEIFRLLREEFPIHPIEKELNVDAEIILAAISRASDLTLRGIRGVIAESAFEINVVDRLTNWRKADLTSDFPYDFLLSDGEGNVRVQVKMQRQKEHRPMTAKEAYRFLPDDMYVVETQRTRGGNRAGEDTRPYRFGEFDILAVSMHPSTNRWSDFRYTVERWLLPRPTNSALLLKFQPVAKAPSEFWTDDFLEAVSWLRSGTMKRIA